MQPELHFEEILTARAYFTKYAEEKVTDVHQLRSILGDLGQHPAQAEMELVMQCFNHKLGFDDLCRYLTWLKRLFMKPEARDADTVRAFVALGGKSDRGGDVNADDLRNACRNFKLTIDIDAMLREVDEDGSGSIEYSEFRSMWDDGTGAVQFQNDDDVPSEAEQLAALKEFLLAKAKESNGPVGRQQSMMKRKQSHKSMEQSRKNTMRLPPVGLSPSKTTNNGKEESKVAAEEVESDEESAPAKQEVKERQNPNANDPFYRRYLMTDPIVVGQKKPAATKRRGPQTLPPVGTPRTARRASPQATPRKSTAGASTAAPAAGGTAEQ